MVLLGMETGGLPFQNGVSEFSSGVSSGPLWQRRVFLEHLYLPLVYTAHQIENSHTNYDIRNNYQTRNTAVVAQ